MEKCVGITLFEGDIVNHINNYSFDFKPVEGEDPDILKFMLFESSATDFSFLMVSQSAFEEGISHNVMVTVFGKNKERVEKVFRAFEKKMPFELQDPPEILSNVLNVYFKDFCRIHGLDYYYK